VRVLRWARDDRTAPPPTGDLADLGALVRPPAAVREAIGQLCAAESARLRLGRPVLGDRGPVGLSGALLAAAIGGRALPVARDLLGQVRAARTGHDLVVHHALARAAGRNGVSADVVADVAAASPLTGILGAPPITRVDVCRRVLTDIVLADPGGRRLVVTAFAVPEADPARAAWRGSVLDGLRSNEQWRDVALDVYRLARQAHGAGHDALVAAAARRVVQRSRPDWEVTPSAIESGGPDPVAPVVDFWRPLARLFFSQRRLVQSRPRLDLVNRVDTAAGAA